MTDAELIAWMREHDYVPRIKAGADRIESLSARLKVAEQMAEAITPFAEACCHLHPAHPLDGETLDGFKVREFLDAAQALTAWKEG